MDGTKINKANSSFWPAPEASRRPQAAASIAGSAARPLGVILCLFVLGLLPSLCPRGFLPAQDPWPARPDGAFPPRGEPAGGAPSPSFPRRGNPSLGLDEAGSRLGRGIDLETRLRIDRGLEYLLKKQNEDGSWTDRVGRKVHNTYQGRIAPHIGGTALARMAFLSSGALPDQGPPER